MGDIPNSPYLDRPLRTLREVASERCEAAELARAAFERVRAESDARNHAAVTVYMTAVNAWLAAQKQAHAAASAASKRAA